MRLCRSSVTKNTMKVCMCHLVGDQKNNIIFINKSGSSLWKNVVIEKTLQKNVIVQYLS